MKLYFVSLGCDKNKVDSEKILDFFICKFNIDIVDRVEDADIAIVNTCAFIGDAKRESFNVIKELYDLKLQKKLKKIMVVGCLATESNYSNELKEELLKYVDVILPQNNYMLELENMTDRVVDVINYSRAIKISEGCDKNCTYCIIPKLRGKLISRKKEDIVLEANKLANCGLRELNIVAQDVLSYGRDIYHKKEIVSLLDDLSKIDNIKWIRLLYCYPEEIDDNLINLIKNNTKILHYIDMPIQHISNRILKSMNRATTKESIKELIYKLRDNIKDIVIRTTLMVGFPGETEDDFSELVDFVEEMNFQNLGCFSYSNEQLATSSNFSNQVPDIEKEKRRKWIMDVVQHRKVLNNNQNEIGKTYEVIIDGYDVGKKMYVARNYKNAKDIDNNIYIATKKNLISGSFCKAKILDFDNYDLIAKLI